MAYALNKIYCRSALGTRVNRDTIRCVKRRIRFQYATSEREKVFLIQKEKVADSKISGYEWTGPHSSPEA